MWVNLLSNAIKFTASGSIGVDLRLEGGRAAFRVTDSGPGIGAGSLQKLNEALGSRDDYEGLEVKGRVVVLLPGAPDFMDELDKKLQTLDAKIKTAVEKRAAGVVFIDAGGRMPGRSSSL